MMEQYDIYCSTPSATAPSSPGRPAFYYSAPASPTHFAISTSPRRPRPPASDAGAPFEFGFPAVEHMTSAEELFCNGQIRPISLSAHFRRPPQTLSPLAEPDALLYRSKSEGQNSKFRVSLSFSPAAKDNKRKTTSQGNCGGLNNSKNNNNSDGKEGKLSGPKDGAGKRKGMSAHEAHYAAKRAQAEEMRKKTYLPYRQGLLGCLGFRYRSYGAINGFARVFNPA
ncbi:Protein of unknown function (DUF1645 [Striga hermonthica]|uniref:Uncharacterized protein n=1 Tax=Striga hermonthica TaxID=68872 RepID=A0A9N7MVV6_STRHE|nr:Protein of unknown function (DUF1645 [Striga hermonthica]